MGFLSSLCLIFAFGASNQLCSDIFSLPLRSVAHFDTVADASITKFVSNDQSYLELDYVPTPIVSLSGSFALLGGKEILLRKDASLALERLARDLFAATSVRMLVASGYRSYEHQNRIALARPDCVKTGFCAKPGFSEHQSGLAIDIFETTTADDFYRNPQWKKAWQWLDANAHEYGWTQSYRKGRDIDGYEVEPWHWRYIGAPMASELKRCDLTFTQWVQWREKSQEARCPQK